MAKVFEVCENPDTAALVIRYLAKEIVVEDPKNFPRKAFTPCLTATSSGTFTPGTQKGKISALAR